MFEVVSAGLVVGFGERTREHLCRVMGETTSAYGVVNVAQARTFASSCAGLCAVVVEGQLVDAERRAGLPELHGEQQPSPLRVIKHVPQLVLENRPAAPPLRRIGGVLRLGLPWGDDAIVAFVRSSRLLARERALLALMRDIAIVYGLSVGEAALLTQVAKGTSPKMLGTRLGLSPNTVKTVTRRVLHKLEAVSLMDALQIMLLMSLERHAVGDDLLVACSRKHLPERRGRRR